MARVETSARKTILCINYEEQKYLDIFNNWMLMLLV